MYMYMSAPYTMSYHMHAHVHVHIGRASRVSSPLHAEADVIRGQGGERTTGCGPLSLRHRCLHGRRRQVQAVLGASSQDSDRLFAVGGLHLLHCAAAGAGCLGF